MTHPTFHRKGIGRALLSRAARASLEGGARSFLIGCIRENPSGGFYTHLGGVEIYRAPRNVDRYETEEIFFGYADIGSLIIED